MDITISIHASLRAVERGITEEGIRAIVDDVSSVMIPSKKNSEVAVMIGLYNEKLWAVLVSNTGNVITVRRAQKNEEKIYYDR